MMPRLPVCFETWDGAYRTALFRAAITGWKYQVRKDMGNKNWHITEQTKRSWR